MWFEFHERIYNLVSKNRNKYMEGYARKGEAFQAVYNLFGFAFALKIFVLESFPNSRLWWDKDDTVVPRGVAWGNVTAFHKSDYVKLFVTKPPPQKMVPTAAEQGSTWWMSSLEYFNSPHASCARPYNPVKRDKIKSRVSRKYFREEVRTEVHVRTEVRTQVVEEHAVEESDSDDCLKHVTKRQLYERMIAMEASFNTRIAALEQNKHPANEGVGVADEGVGVVDEAVDLNLPANEGIDRPANVVDDSHVNLPVKEAVEQEANIVIELFGDLPEPNKVAENVQHSKVCVEQETKQPMEEVSEDNNKVDVEQEAKQPMEEFSEDNNKVYVEQEAKQKEDLVFKDIYVTTTRQDSTKDLEDLIDFSSLPDNMFQDVNGLDPQVDVGVTHVDAEQNLDLNGLIDQQMDVGGTDNSGINVDLNGLIDEQMDGDFMDNSGVVDLNSLFDEAMDDDVVTLRVPFERERKKSRHVSSPYTAPPPTTPRRARKCRPRSRIYKSKIQSLVGPDGSEIKVEPWKEEPNRPEGSCSTRINCHSDINMLLRSRKDMKFCLPWSNAELCNTFWAALVCKDDNRKGWLSDLHIDVWVLYMWQFRPEDVDWVMVGPYFSRQLLNRDKPMYYANGIIYGVLWVAPNVDKVYIPVNEPDIHWALAVLDIRSGVVTIYDSLGGPDEEGRPWWDTWRQNFSRDISVYLEDSQVMANKNIDPRTYSITFRYAKYVPLQGGYYGDCGIWLCIFFVPFDKRSSIDGR